MKTLRIAVATGLCLLATAAISFADPAGQTPVRVGIYQNSPKVAWSASGKPEGLFVDLIEAIAAEEHWTLEYVRGTWAEGLDRLAKSEIDLMPDVAFSAEREQLYAFHREPVLSDWFQIFARRDSGIRSLLDLNGKRVAVLERSLQQDEFKKMIEGFDLTTVLLARPDYDSAFSAVAEGTADAVIANRFYGAAHLRGGILEDTAIIFNPTRVFFAAPLASDRSRLEAIDRRLAEMKQDPSSIYFRSLERWTSEKAGFHLPGWIKGAGIAAAAFLLLSLLWGLALKQQVSRRTRELKSQNEEIERLYSSVRESQELFALFMRHSPIYTFIKEVTATESRVLVASENYRDMIGIPGPEMEGKTMAELFPPEFAAKISADDWAVVSKGEVLKLEEELNGRHYVTIKFPIPREEKTFLAGYTIDITERKQAEENQAKLQSQLIQAQKMEAVGRLAGGVAHDFNNMLCAILGYAELTLADTAPAHPHYADLLEIRKAAERSADLTRQLLAYARKQTVSPQVLDLNATVERMLKMLRRLIGENIDLRWQPAQNLGLVKMDPSQIDQILTNLCVNARDAIAGVGQITLETANVSFSREHCALHAEHLPGDFAMLAVSDNGCGMDKKTIGQLFEPFFTTKGQGQGTGLGLATVYGIVKQNNGFIDVFSESGRGTTFKIYLPLNADGREPPDAPRAAGPALRGLETILLVEDEPSILAMGKTMLERLGYRVLGAATPAHALRLAQEHSGEIHLLMTDVVMPEMNGRDLNRSLSARHPGLKCLFMSGYTPDAIAHHGVLDEGVHFIQKPFTMATLSAKVRQALDA